MPDDHRPFDLKRLPAWSADGDLHVIVEAPRGSTVKMAWDADLGVFDARRALPLGVTYPYDWGFVPGTLAEDGDPLDAIVLHDAGTYPGVLLRCRALGMIMLEEDEDDGRQRNDRLVASPVWSDRLADVQSMDDLSPRLRHEIERFFLNTTFFTSKNAAILGWKSREETEAEVRRLMIGKDGQGA